MQEHMDSRFLEGHARRGGAELSSTLALTVSAHDTWPPSPPVPDYYDLTPVADARGQQPTHEAYQQGSEDGCPKTLDLKAFHE